MHFYTDINCIIDERITMSWNCITSKLECFMWDTPHWNSSVSGQLQVTSSSMIAVVPQQQNG